MTQFVLLRMTEVISGSEAGSTMQHYPSVCMCVLLLTLDDILKELHRSHYVFILLREARRLFLCLPRLIYYA